MAKLNCDYCGCSTGYVTRCPSYNDHVNSCHISFSKGRKSGQNEIDQLKQQIAQLKHEKDQIKQEMDFRMQLIIRYDITRLYTPNRQMLEIFDEILKLQDKPIKTKDDLIKVCQYIGTLLKEYCEKISVGTTEFKDIRLFQQDVLRLMKEKTESNEVMSIIQLVIQNLENELAGQPIINIMALLF